MEVKSRVKRIIKEIDDSGLPEKLLAALIASVLLHIVLTALLGE